MTPSGPTVHACPSVGRRSRIRLLAVASVAFALAGSSFAVQAGAQQQGGAAPSAAAPAAAASAAPAFNMNEVMRAILFPNANIIFNVQVEDPGAERSPAEQKSGGAGFSITSWGNNLYTPWEIVTYAAVALEESATLLNKMDRQCQGNKPVPANQAEWMKYTAELSATAKAVYAAAQMKNRDTVIELTDRLQESCAACHNAYRRGGDATRCVPR